MAFASGLDDHLLLPGWEQLVYFVAEYSVLELHEKVYFVYLYCVARNSTNFLVPEKRSQIIACLF